MKPILHAVLDRALLLVMIATVALPLLLAGWLRFPHAHSPVAERLHNPLLFGTPYAFANVPFSPSTLLSAKYQTGFADDYDHSFAAREWVLRGIKEIYWRVFHTSDGVVVGQHSTLFDKLYVDEYASERIDKDFFQRQTADLRQLQDFCAARGIAFAFLITPSKASVYPEELPAWDQRRFKPGLRRFDSLLALLKEKGIHCVDGHQIAMDLKPRSDLPLYPRGGIHWADPTALATGDALLEVLAGQGLPVKPITRYQTKVTEQVRDGWDRDLASFLNTLTTFTYPVTEITPEHETPSSRYHPNLVLMGGSFNLKLLRLLGTSGQFSEIEYLDYYTHAKDCETDGRLNHLYSPTPPVDFQREIFAADALVLEANEQAMYVPNHVTRFLNDVLAVLPDPHSPKLPFKYEAFNPYQWGDTLSLVAGKDQARCFGGFTEPGPSGAYTEGHWAAVRFTAPPAPRDMEMQVTGDPFLSGERLTRQEADVYVNGRSLGTMVWDKPGRAVRSVVVPNDLLSDGHTRVQFRIPYAVSPLELGTASETRQLGILVSGIRFVPVGQGTPGKVRGQYQWGETISLKKDRDPAAPVRLDGFEPGDSTGAFTLGPVATIRFVAPPAAQDMVLTVNAGAFIADTRMPVQNAEVRVNGHSAGQWEWRDPRPYPRDLLVPREWLPGGETVVEFRIAKPTSPADIGMNQDTRKFGVLVAEVRLHQRADAPPPDQGRQRDY